MIRCPNCAIQILRKRGDAPFAIESYTERVGRRFSGQYVTRRMICDAELSAQIDGVTLMALLRRGWLEVVEVVDMSASSWVKRTSVVRYRFVDKGGSR